MADGRGHEGYAAADAGIDVPPSGSPRSRSGLRGTGGAWCMVHVFLGLFFVAADLIGWEGASLSLPIRGRDKNRDPGRGCLNIGGS